MKNKKAIRATLIKGRTDRLSRPNRGHTCESLKGKTQKRSVTPKGGIKLSSSTSRSIKEETKLSDRLQQLTNASNAEKDGTLKREDEWSKCAGVPSRKERVGCPNPP